jgi:hypothetical protein
MVQEKINDDNTHLFILLLRRVSLVSLLMSSMLSRMGLPIYHIMV